MKFGIYVTLWEGTSDSQLLDSVMGDNYKTQARNCETEATATPQRKCGNRRNWGIYEGHLESKERSRIQPAQLFQCS
jgi:hypothetical protein